MARCVGASQALHRWTPTPQSVILLWTPTRIGLIASPKPQPLNAVPHNTHEAGEAKTLADSKTVPDSSAPGLAPEAPSLCLPKPEIRDHELIVRVGSGSYGEVWLARNVMGTYRAVKIV